MSGREGCNSQAFCKENMECLDRVNAGSNTVTALQKNGNALTDAIFSEKPLERKMGPQGFEPWTSGL